MSETGKHDDARMSQTQSKIFSSEDQKSFYLQYTVVDFTKQLKMSEDS